MFWTNLWLFFIALPVILAVVWGVILLFGWAFVSLNVVGFFRRTFYTILTFIIFFCRHPFLTVGIIVLFCIYPLYTDPTFGIAHLIVVCCPYFAVRWIYTKLQKEFTNKEKHN